MLDFKLTLNNSENTAASLLKGETVKFEDFEKVNFPSCTVLKNEKNEAESRVNIRSNTIINTSGNTLRLGRFSSLYKHGIVPDFHNREVAIHICNCTWQGEAQWVSRTPYEMGLYPVAEHDFTHIDKTVAGFGSWTTARYYPLVVIEDKTAKKAYFFELEPCGGWSVELGVCRVDGVCALTVDCSGCNENYDGHARKLAANESFETPKVLYGVAESFEEAVNSLLKYKRRNTKTLKQVPVCFNDYMNCLWARPSRERLIPLIDAAAKAGAEVFCIDDGWFIRSGPKYGFGDWIEDDSLFGEGGLKGILDYIASKGMKSGLWFELETAFDTAAIINIAPDALLKRGGIIIGTDRLLLNFRCKAVTDYLLERIKYFYSLGMRYIKNDYNHTTGIGCDGENMSFAAAMTDNYRAFISFIDRVYEECPELIIENCASGAMRCDNGTLSHFQLQSTSDQEIYTNYPAIIRGMQCCMLPEKSGIWSYPYPMIYAHRLDDEATLDDNFFAFCKDGEQTVFNMSSAFFGLMTLSGRIDKCDDYNLSLIKKGIETYKADREFISEAYPVFIGEPAKLYSNYTCVLALSNGKKLRFAVFKNGGEEKAEFTLPSGMVLENVREIYPLTDKTSALSLDGNILSFAHEKSVCARVYEADIKEENTK